MGDPVQITPFQVIDGRSGQAVPGAGFAIYTYIAGTTTPRATYTDSTLGTPNTNPVLTNSAGYAVNGSTITGIWVGPLAYKFVLKDNFGVEVWTQDNIIDSGLALKSLLATSGGAGIIGYDRPLGSALTVQQALAYALAGNVINYGADPTGAADSLAAFNACYAGNDAVFVPNGTYRLSATFTMDRSNTRMTGQSLGAVIEYTGSSALTDVVQMGGTLLYNQVLENLTIKGNSHVQNAVHLNLANHCNLTNLRVRDAVVGLFHDNGVSNTLTNIECSSNSGAFAFQPTTGLKILGSNTVAVISPTMEGVSGTGIAITTSPCVTIINGTSEANNKGVTSDVTSTVLILNLDNEANTSWDVEIAGKGQVIGGFYLFGIHFTSTAIFGCLIGVTTNQITIDAGARGIVIDQNVYDSVSGGTITDNGTGTVIGSNIDQNGGAFFSEKEYSFAALTKTIMGNFLLTAGANSILLGSGTGAFSIQAPINGLTSNTAFNVVSAAGGSANNAIVATLTLSDGTTPAPMFNTEVKLYLAGFTLRAGANTLDLNGEGAIPIFKSTDGTNLTTAFSTGSGIVYLFRETGAWYCISQ